MKNISLILLASTLFLATSPAYSDAPKVPTAAPYIVLSENFDEPNGYGFCIDTMSQGQSEVLQTHSCKPASEEEVPRNFKNHDVRFEYDEENQRIESYAFEGYCMQVLLSGYEAVFALLECSDHPHQKIVYNQKDKSFRLNEDTGSCISVAAETKPAGPYSSRVLRLTNCEETEAGLRQWTVVSE